MSYVPSGRVPIGKMTPPIDPSRASTVSFVGQNPLCETLTVTAAPSVPRPTVGGCVAQLLGVPEKTTAPRGFCVVRNVPRSVFPVDASQVLSGLTMVSFSDRMGGPQPATVGDSVCG